MSATSVANVMFGSPAGSKTSLNCVQLGDVPGNLGIISRHSKHASANWGTLTEQWDVSSGGSAWVHVIFKWTPGGSFAAGRIRVTVYCISGSCAAVKIMRASSLDGTATPDLTGNTTEPGGLSAGVTQVLTGTTPNTYQTGYFAVVTGWPAHTVDIKITKIEWGVGGVFQDIWVPGGVRQTYICGGVRLG